MIVRTVASAGLLALVCLGGPRTFADDAHREATTVSSIGTFGSQELLKRTAKLTPGKSTKAQVQALLGAPWRTVQYSDLGVLEDEIWEYRGIDPGGSYRIHIEFDHHDVVHLIGKIPDGTPGRAPAQAGPASGVK